MKNTLVLLLAITLLASACTRSRVVTMNAMRPADIRLAPEVKSILMLDRTQQKKGIDILEGVLTGELPQEDRAAVQQTLNNLRAELQRSPRFTGMVASERLDGNSLTALFPNPLDWGKISDLCSKYNTQAVVAIEIFDSDFILTDGKRKTKKTVGEGSNKKEVEVDEYYAEGVANIKIGIRLYDQLNKTIIDEQLISRTNTWKAAAASKAEAIAKLINKRDATIQIASGIGSDYAFKIAPLPIRISRSFYSKNKKSPEIAIGSRQADVNQWSEALETWKGGINHARQKQAGFLTYNVAVAYEVLGDFDLAIQWAQDAFTKFGNKKAREYVHTLRARKNSEERASEQMK